MIVFVAGASMTDGDGFIGRAAAVARDLRTWLAAVRSGALASGALEWALFVLAVFLVMGYAGTYLALERRNGWFLIGLGGVTVMVAVSNLASNVAWLLAAFVSSAALLAAPGKPMPASRHWGLLSGAGQERRGFRAVSLRSAVISAYAFQKAGFFIHEKG